MVKYLLHEEGWEEVKAIFNDAVDGSFELHSLDLILKEAGSALQRHGSRETALKIYRKLLTQTIISYHRQDAQILEEAFDIALQNGLSIYDAAYIALAKGLGAEFVTSDKKQADVAKSVVKVREVR